jgi:hypothetical protein
MPFTDTLDIDTGFITQIELNRKKRELQIL